MTQMKTIAEWMAERGVSITKLVAASALDQRVVEAILHNRYTPSPQQRRSIATALQVTPEQVQWGHQAQVSHVYGHGPQFGRSP